MNQKIYNIYQEIGLKDLIDKICGNNTYEIHKRICIGTKTKVEIILHQQEFRDFLNDDQNSLTEILNFLTELKSTESIYEGKRFNYQKTSSFILYCRKYCQAIELTINNLEKLNYESDLLKNFFQELQTIQTSSSFNQLKDYTDKAYQALNLMLVFDVDISTNNIYKEDKNLISYEQELLSIIEKLSIRITSPGYIPTSLNSFTNFSLLKEVFPDEIKIIEQFYRSYHKYNFLSFDEILLELQYYLQLKHFYQSISKQNISFCQAQINEEQLFDIKSMYDISLVHKVENIIPNDLTLSKDDPRIVLIAGANSGGKTSFIRAITINLLLFNAVGYLFSQQANISTYTDIHAIFTSFQNSLDKGYLNQGEDGVLNCPENSIVILNELFHDLDEERALESFKQIFNKIINTKSLLIMVTHNLEIIKFLQCLNIQLYSPIIDKTNEYNRTYKIEQNIDNYNTFVETILEKYGLLKNQLFQNVVGVSDEK